MSKMSRKMIICCVTFHTFDKIWVALIVIHTWFPPMASTSISIKLFKKFPSDIMALAVFHEISLYAFITNIHSQMVWTGLGGLANDLNKNKENLENQTNLHEFMMNKQTWFQWRQTCQDPAERVEQLQEQASLQRETPRLHSSPQQWSERKEIGNMFVGFDLKACTINANKT